MMMSEFRRADFDESFKRLIEHEGGYVNHPSDPGGETMFGVTARVARANGYAGPMRQLPLSTARSIAKAVYWDSLGCDDYDNRVSVLLFDTLYNGGRPVLWAQKACGVEADGQLGPGTRKALREVDPLAFALSFCAARIEYMTGLKIWPDFGKGWARRVASTMKDAAA
jgi:lysozyme family protein